MYTAYDQYSRIFFNVFFVFLTFFTFFIFFILPEFSGFSTGFYKKNGNIKQRPKMMINLSTS